MGHQITGHYISNSLIKVIKLTKMYISFIDLYLSINNWIIFQRWTTGIFFFHERNRYASLLVDYIILLIVWREKGVSRIVPIYKSSSMHR